MSRRLEEASVGPLLIEIQSAPPTFNTDVAPQWHPS